MRLVIPAIVTAADVLAAQAAVIAAMAAGELSPDEAATVAGVLEAKRKAVELVEVEARLRAAWLAARRRQSTSSARVESPPGTTAAR